jgi:hypothetical protein
MHQLDTRGWHRCNSKLQQSDEYIRPTSSGKQETSNQLTISSPPELQQQGKRCSIESASWWVLCYTPAGAKNVAMLCRHQAMKSAFQLLTRGLQGG